MPSDTLPSTHPLLPWGFDEWHQTHALEFAREGWQAGRVLNVNRSNWTVHDGHSAMRAELTGRLSWLQETSAERPCVGDFVLIQVLDDGDWAIIDEVLPRRTVLQRKTAGRDVERQIIASNVDVAYIVQGCDADYNLRRLERYLITVRDGGVTPRFVLNKADLASAEQRAVMTEQILARFPDMTPLFVSTVSGEGLDTLAESMEPGQTVCLLGSSGVGKTTILNALLGESRHATGAVRESDQRGRHTTTRRHVEQLANGALIIDTPGMRELGVLAEEDGLSSTFSDIEMLAGSCRFSDCSHESETGCAVLEAVESGEIDPDRLSSWRKLNRESERHLLSIAEKRRKDKSQGKLYKRIIQSKRDRR